MIKIPKTKTGGVDIMDFLVKASFLAGINFTREIIKEVQSKETGEVFKKAAEARLKKMPGDEFNKLVSGTEKEKVFGLFYDD